MKRKHFLRNAAQTAVSSQLSAITYQLLTYYLRRRIQNYVYAAFYRKEKGH
ncbi:hypothetical protein [Okeania sp. SIO2C2]|uniref:hypothetical protein n=1 Tax=Okeania sp. SIO2C2 TaxID=2607787 RepID=UPI00257DD43B|nr:hypothetical protein [Okeania sp. SIO2C2]